MHAPLNDHTRGLIGAPELAVMKQSAILVNVAAGGIVDEAALAEALEPGIGRRRRARRILARARWPRITRC